METSLFRNIAIIAHVDHGKTTLLDGMLRQSGIFRDNQVLQDRVMDNIDLERERGITIMAKNTAIFYGDYKINIVDTPGHADFGGEVERTLKLVDGVLLLVDSSEGPLPQTRFVLKKTLELNLPIIVVINKIDRKDARINEVMEEIYYLFIDLDANDEQIEFPVIYTNAREGIAMKDLKDESADNLKPLFDEIIEFIPPPSGFDDKPLQVLIAHIGYDDYVGRLCIGRVFNGIINSNSTIAYGTGTDNMKKDKISSLFTFHGLDKKLVDKAYTGDIIAVSGLDNIQIGDTITSADTPEFLVPIKVDEPTISMVFSVNNSPFAGREGKYVTSRNLKDRLFKEAMHNVSIKVEETEATDSLKVMGRGELQLAILIEMMRREGYEFCVSKPEIILKEIDGEVCEPIEFLVIDCPDEYMGIVNQKMGIRRGLLMNVANYEMGRMRMDFHIPAQGLIGYRGEFLTDTRGTGIMHHVFEKYAKFTGGLTSRNSGVIVADRQGKATPYALFHLQPRGTLFIPETTEVYKGMIIGEHAKDGDIFVNAAKEKKLTNMRASGTDENVKLSPYILMSIEKALEFIKEDEMVEITPQSVRLRKKYIDKIKRGE